MKKLILRIDGGIVSIVSGTEYLKDIELEIRDYDCNGIDEDKLEEDREGNNYFLQEV